MSWSQALQEDVHSTAAVSRPRASGHGLEALTERWQALTRDDPVTGRHGLVLRFALVNIVALALVGAAAAQGWVGALLAADGAMFSLAITAVFAVGLVWSGHMALGVSRELDEVKRYQRFPHNPAPDYMRRTEGCDGQSRATIATSYRLELGARIAPVRHIANSLVLLGLIGTVIGFIIALSGVEPDVAADVGAVGPMISTLINGMSIALHTTLVGALLHVWLLVVVRLIEGASVSLLVSSVELGERHARE